jgi:DnaD/phage-associated family protein
MLGSLLVEISDIAELKCTLRFFWYAAQVRGAPKCVPVSDLETDALLVGTLGSSTEVLRGIRLAVTRGTLIDVEGWLLLRTPQNQRATETLGEVPTAAIQEPLGVSRPNVYALYESNIGMITPMVAEELRSAEEEFPSDWLEAAIREAVKSNARKWRYVLAVLERWKRDGRGDRVSGEPGRHPEKVTAAEYLERRERP